MTIRNITADDVIDGLSMVDAEIKKLNQRKKELEHDLKEFLGKDVMSELADKDYGCGTANVQTEKYKVKAVVSKKIDWDQNGLKAAYETLKAADENPDEYIKTKFEVSESAYKNWPSKIQAFFEPHRTVGQSPVKFTFERKEENGNI